MSKELTEQLVRALPDRCYIGQGYGEIPLPLTRAIHLDPWIDLPRSHGVRHHSRVSTEAQACRHPRFGRHPCVWSLSEDRQVGRNTSRV